MASSVSYAENIDPALLQSSSSASASPSTMYPRINVSNTEPAPRTPMLHLLPLLCPPLLPAHLRSHVPPLLSPHSAVTSYCSEATIDSIEFPLPCINGAEPRNKVYGG
ncbi:hypothetical protein BDD12DRAFT_889324 [Trichophaea hybrida]|nr:hypothetical protein BDD12DRAFT_889324 [Trichophaea hybrida]